MYSLRVLKVGEARAVGPISFYMSHWDELEYSPHFIWLAQDQEQTVLVNTGLPQDPDDLRILNLACQAAHPENYFAPDHIWSPQQVLAQVGVEPKDVNAILITAMGAYATGNLESFPAADIYMSRTGWVDFVAPTRPLNVNRKTIFTDSTITHLLTKVWSRVHLVGDEEEVLPGIKMFWVGCHHRGSMAVSIQTAKGKVVISDSIFMYENFEPGIPIGVVENIFECQDALERIRKEADIVIPAHDPEVLARYPDGIIA
jgi:glyoxylase-like metal-dependent hydrolase (beta-lactamase superfamily II)